MYVLSGEDEVLANKHDYSKMKKKFTYEHRVT